MLTKGEVYADPGADFYLKREPEQIKTRAIRQLITLGYDVSLTLAVAWPRVYVRTRSRLHPFM